MLTLENIDEICTLLRQGERIQAVQQLRGQLGRTSMSLYDAKKLLLDEGVYVTTVEAVREKLCTLYLEDPADLISEKQARIGHLMKEIQSLHGQRGTFMIPPPDNWDNESLNVNSVTVAQYMPTEEHRQVLIDCLNFVRHYGAQIDEEYWAYVIQDIRERPLLLEPEYAAMEARLAAELEADTVGADSIWGRWPSHPKPPAEDSTS